MDHTQNYASAAPISTGYGDFWYSRRSVVYHPSIWKDHFVTHTLDFEEICDGEKEEHERLKEQVRKMLVSSAPNNKSLLHKLEHIDSVQCLGVAYHFEPEIHESLRDIYNDASNKCNKDDQDEACDGLHFVALRFRLLRQQGYNVSPDIFRKFKNSQAEFDNSLVENNKIRGLLSLYEAANLSIPGEDILHEALLFCTNELESMLPHISNLLLRKQVSRALEMPIRRSLNRVEAKHYMSLSEEIKSLPHDNEVLLKFAKLDFNILQKMHQKELNEITMWWKTLDVVNKFPFARDRLVEGYFWILCVYFEPEYCLARRMLTKVIALTSIIDDIYEVQGTVKELQIFTDAIQRLDIKSSDQLPGYMTLCYDALLDVYAEMEKNLADTGKSYRVQYVKEEMKKLARAYLEEAKWVYNNYTPTIEEYMNIALVSCGYSMLITTSFVGMGDLVTKETFDWVTSGPTIVRASTIICRLMDDMVGQGFEPKRSAIECYMKQTGASTETIFSELQKQVSRAWEDINQECLHPTAMPMPILARVLNFARVMNLLYKDEDMYTNSTTKLKGIITSVLLEPMKTL